MNGRVLSFYLSSWRMCIELALVREITRNTVLTPVPTGPKEIVGLLNLRGQVITVFDLDCLMSGGKTPAKARSACIILKAKDSPIGLAIDRPGDVFDVTGDMFEGPPANLQGIDTALVRGVIKTPRELLVLLNLEKLIG